LLSNFGGGCDGGGKGYLGSEDKAFTVATHQDQQLFVSEPVTYDMMQVTAPVNKQNRKPGDACHTLAKGNAQAAAVVYENHGQDSRIKEVNTAPQLNAKAGTGGGNLPLVQQSIATERERESSRALQRAEPGLQADDKTDEHAGHGSGTHEPGHTFVMATGQGGAEVLKGQCPTLSCNHEAPIVMTKDDKN
jgi:hypothetical protein